MEVHGINRTRPALQSVHLPFIHNETAYPVSVRFDATDHEEIPWLSNFAGLGLAQAQQIIGASISKSTPAPPIPAEY